MEYNDRSGTPRKNEELVAALIAVHRALLNPVRVPPELIIYLPTIRESLIELLTLRKAMERDKEKREDNAKG